MYIFAYICLLFSLLCALWGGLVAILQLWNGADGNEVQESWLCSRMHWGVSGGFLLASALLLHALFWQDYRLEYVASYTDALLPLFYRLTAFWAGQPGSMLFWALASALCGSLFALGRACAGLGVRTRLWFWLLFYANMAFFALILTSWSNPFLMQTPVPPDGNGLNPLLQNPGMIFHPPLLFMGYAGFTVPACLALAEMLAPEEAQSPAWAMQTRAYIIWAWVLLTAGIVLGAWWAYMELGWGGYWAWDPVENASLLPWLVATAALHLLVIERRSGKLGRSACALMALTLVSAFFATYLTRSGVIQSVHAFGDGGVGTPLTIYILLGLFLSLYVPFGRSSRAAPLASAMSREGFLVLTAWLLLALTLIILLATMWPVISKLWTQGSQGLEAAFYNRVCLPLGALLLLLLAACPWLGWQGGFSGGSVPRGFCAMLGVFFGAAIWIWFLGYRQPVALLSACGAIAAIVNVVILAFGRNAWQRPRLLGAMGGHLGLGLLALGVAFSGPYTVDREILMAKGQSETVGAYSITLEAVSDGKRPAYDFLQARLKISENGRDLGQLLPERRIYAKFGNMQFSEVDVLSSLGRDIYASLLGMDEDYRVLVKISIEPLVSWIWIGGTLLCLLPLIGLWRVRRG